MKKRVFLIHGWEGAPDEGWQLWIKPKLIEKGFEVIMPEMPDANTPTLKKWLSHLTKVVGTPDEECYFVGHSLGCITVLRYLESLKNDQKVGGVILVAGFSHDLEYEEYKGELNSFFENKLDFEKVKQHCDTFVAIHSSDDSWVKMKHLNIFEEKLGAKGIAMENMKHFSADDEINELPIVLYELLEMSQK